MNVLKRLPGGIALLLLGGLVLMYIADPVITGRMVGLVFGGATSPEERVPGAAGADLPLASPTARSISSKALDEAIAYGESTGSHALIVYHNGAIQLEHYYPGHSAESRTATQSMHKSVLALVVGIAIRDGFIASVDDPAARYLREWAGDPRSRITIRQMLQQSSGIDFPTIGFNPVGGFFQLTLGGNITPVALGQSLAAEPGMKFEYNSINPQALGLIVERATGKRYAQYLSESLWQRIGAEDAYVALDSEEHRVARFFCCLSATARSWLRVGLLHLNSGMVDGTEVVPAAWMRDVVTPAPTNPNYGYLTWLGNEYQQQRFYNSKTRTSVLHSEPFAARDVVYFDGFGGQRVYAVPSLGLVIVRTGSLATDWDDAKLPNLIIRDITSANENP